MKKLAWLLSVAMVFSLALSACGDDETSSSSTPAENEDTSVLVNESQAESIAAAEVASETQAAAEVASGETPSEAAAPAAVTGLTGLFASYDSQRFPDETRAPKIQLSEEGGFVFHLNLGDGRLGVLTGTYTLAGTQLTLQVLYADSDDYLGAEITSLPFTLDGENILIYGGSPVGMTKSGDNFVREGSVLESGTGEDGTTGAGDDKNMYILAPGERIEGGAPGGLPGTPADAVAAQPQDPAAADAAPQDVAAP